MAAVVALAATPASDFFLDPKPPKYWKHLIRAPFNSAWPVSAR
jgi:hypothetical protein